MMMTPAVMADPTAKALYDLLTLLADPEKSKARLEEVSTQLANLTAQEARVRDLLDRGREEAEARSADFIKLQKISEDMNVKAKQLNEREQGLTTHSETLGQWEHRLVAAEADIADRKAKIERRETAMDEREAEAVRRIEALQQRTQEMDTKEKDMAARMEKLADLVMKAPR